MLHTEEVSTRGTPENTETPNEYVIVQSRSVCINACMWGHVKKGQVLTFRRAAYGVVSKASATLLEVGTGRASVSRGNRHLATPFRAANSTWRCA